MGTALMPAGSTRRVPGVSSGALYRRSTPRTRSTVAFGTLPDETPPGRVGVAAKAGVTDPTPYRTGRAARPPRRPRRLSAPPPQAVCALVFRMLSFASQDVHSRP